MTKLQQYKKVCQKHLVLYDDAYIDVIFGVIFANRLDSKPVWLYLVGPPGSGKTEILQSLSGFPEIVPRSKLTRHTLVSGLITEKKDPSLLPHLDGKVLVIKDFTAMLSTRRDELMEIVGTLRDAYDGEVSHTFGTGVTRSYRSKFGVIAAVTQVIDRHHLQLAELGERFLIYRQPEISDNEKRARSMKASRSHSTETQEKEMREAAHSILSLEPYIPSISKEHRQSIIKIAQVVAKARSTIHRDRSSQEPDFPQLEVPTRISKQLVDLALGITMARQRKQVTSSEVSLVSIAGLHSIPPKRLKLIEAFLYYWPNPASFHDIFERIPLSELTVRRWIEDLYLLGVLSRKIILEGKKLRKTYLWSLRDGKILQPLLMSG